MRADVVLRAAGRLPASWYLSVRQRKGRRHILQQARGVRRPTIRAAVVADKSATRQDVDIAARLLAAYRAATRAAAPSTREDLWSHIADRQQAFFELLARDDAAELAHYLCNVARHGASEGILQGAGEFNRITRNRPYREFLGLMTKDKLVSLAEAVGALPVENPEQGVYGLSLYRDPGELVDRISERIGVPITPPDVDGGLLKLDTGRGLFGERDANAIYTAWLLEQVLDGHERPRVCEIGGGTGRVAYWSTRLGLRSYTVVDLPHVNVVQGYYALKNLPEEQVTLYGEGGLESDSLRIVPAHAIAEIIEPPFDLVLNQD